MLEQILEKLAVAIALLGGLVIGWFWHHLLGKKRLESAHRSAERILVEAEKEAENLKKEKFLEAKDQQLELKTRFEAEAEKRRKALEFQERKVADRESALRHNHDELERTGRDLQSERDRLKSKDQELTRKIEQLDQQLRESTQQLERLAHMSSEEALEQLKFFQQVGLPDNEFHDVQSLKERVSSDGSFSNSREKI